MSLLLLRWIFCRAIVVSLILLPTSECRSSALICVRSEAYHVIGLGRS